MVDAHAISISSGPIATTLSLKDTSLSLEQSSSKSQQEIPFRNVIAATINTETRVVEVTYLYKKKKDSFGLFVAEGQVKDTELDRTSEWVEALMNASYAGIPRCRRLLILINPFGGTKKGVASFEQKVRPIFAAAGCSMEVVRTTHRNHAYEIVKSMSLTYDAVITVSGDGLIHEVMNGLAQHEDPVRALATPVAPIPTGTGNGLALNLLGIKEGFDVCAAALNVVKGLPMKVDLFSLTQNGKRTISFMAQTLGLMADLDFDTEHLRWMGDTRFMYGFIKGLIRYKPCPIQLSYKLAEDDKHKMATAVRAQSAGQRQTFNPGAETSSGEPSTGLDLPLQSNDDQEGWTTFDESIYYVYAGKGPYVARDLMAFPVSLPNDGLIDIEIMGNSSRIDIIAASDGANKGANYWHPKIQYMKAYAYRVKPLTAKGNLSVDGERFPFEEFQIDVHKGLGTLLSLYGHYVSSFEPRIPETK